VRFLPHWLVNGVISLFRLARRTPPARRSA
jgi:hypothetical protein